MYFKKSTLPFGRDHLVFLQEKKMIKVIMNEQTGKYHAEVSKKMLIACYFSDEKDPEGVSGIKCPQFMHNGQYQKIGHPGQEGKNKAQGVQSPTFLRNPFSLI
jgi:hypothetical protein